MCCRSRRRNIGLMCSSNIGLRSAIIFAIPRNRVAMCPLENKVGAVEDTRMSLIDQHLDNCISGSIIRSGLGKSSWTVVQPELRCPLWVKSRHVRRKTACPLYPGMRHQMRHMDVRLGPLAEITAQREQILD